MAIFQNFPKLRVDGCQYWTYKFKQLTKIIHKFYKKPVSNPLLMLENSAMPMKVKRNSLAKEGIPQLRNTTRDLPWSTKVEILSEFSHKLMISGCNEKF